MFTIEMLPAGRGDCLWIEYGHNPAAPHRILIDGGVHATADELRRRIEALPMDQRFFELLVITHIDLDHIVGILKLLKNPPDGLRFGEIWYNAWHHLEEDDGVLGAKQGEQLAAILEQAPFSAAWNRSFDGKAVALKDGRNDLPQIRLAGGMNAILLSPTRKRLNDLRPVWAREIRAAGMEPGEAFREPEEEDDGLLGEEEKIDIDDLADTPFTEDISEANGSSIAFLAEFEGKRCVFTGDAFASDVAASLDRIAAEQGEQTVALDAFKISHHGGPKNTNANLLKSIHCPRFLFSTDGSYYKHPFRESVARVIVHSHRPTPALFFNYHSKFTEIWADPVLCDGRYTAHYPSNKVGLSVSL